MKYKPCTYCRENNLETYKAATWFTGIERPEFNIDHVRKKIKGFTKTYGKNNFRFKAYPRFSIGVDELENDINMLIDAEDWHPDVILTDYADIFRKPKGEFRHGIDEIWMTHARWASQYKCLVGTVSQSSKESWELRDVKAKHASENYRNPAHVDKFFTLNQTPEEKKAMRMRVLVAAARDEGFDSNKGVTVLQNLDVAQSVIDSDFLEK